MPMNTKFFILILLAASYSGAALAQDAAAWIAAQGMEARDVKAFQDLEIVIAKAADGEEKAAVLRQGKPLWQSGPKDADAHAKWAVHAVGVDITGDGHPDLHLTSTSGNNVVHHILQLKPQVKRIAVQSLGSVGGSEFFEVPGRKGRVMVSADDSNANVFAPYATSYFPLVVLEVGKGRFQLAKDLMQSKLPGQPPAVCATPAPSGNAWLRERCAEFGTVRRQERVAQIRRGLEAAKATRTSDKVKWEDWVAKGAVGPVAAEVNRYVYTGHGAAGLNWLETVWPGNDSIKIEMVKRLRDTHARSAFADDLRSLASGR